MAILPIDLQTMYASLDKVSKLTAQKEQAEKLTVAMQQEELTHKLQEQAKTVEKSNLNDDGPVHIKDKQDSSDTHYESQKKQESEEQQQEQEYEHIKDPSLGQRIDISG